MATPVVRDDAETMLREEKHLAIPSVRIERPAVRERYGRAFAPVFVIDLPTVFGCDVTHVFPPSLKNANGSLGGRATS